MTEMNIIVHCSTRCSQPCALCEIDAEAVFSALISARHFSGTAPEMFVHAACIDLCGACDACAERMPREERKAVFLGEIGSDAISQHGDFDQARDTLVSEADLHDPAAVAP